MMIPILIGAAGGVASGLLGVGGGLVFVPLMTHFLRLDQRKAQGTSLAILVFTALAGALTYRASGAVDLTMALWLAGGAIVGARLGAKATARWSSAALRRAFGVVALLVALRLFLVQLPEGRWLAQPGWAGIAFEVLTGVGTGYLSGLLGVGGGIIVVPALTLLFGVAQHAAQGISLFMIVPTALVGAFTHLRMGNVERRVVLPIAIGSIVAAVAAAAVAHLLPAATLRILFGLLLAWTGARMALKPAAR